MSGYPMDEVECSRCNGNGEVETWGDFFNEGFARCWECGGSGYVEVCANCLDDWDGCNVCQPARASGRSLAGAPESVGGEKQDT